MDGRGFVLFAMLEYLTDIMEDVHDFSWVSAKGAHALILCRMEEGKVNFLMSYKLDLIRRAHAQKIVNGQTGSSKYKAKTESQVHPAIFFSKW